jgi:hypothetical protein
MGGELHINKPLSQIAMNYSPMGFVADQIAPTVKVTNKSDAYNVYNIADVFRTVDDLKAPEREANYITTSLSSDTFMCKGRSLKKAMNYEDMANADAKEIFASRSSNTKIVKDKLLLNKEVRVGSMVTSGSNVGSYSATASAWNTAGAGNDPIGDIDTALDNVQYLTGYRPNSILFGQSAWQTFSRNSNVIDLVFGNSAVGKARVPSADNIKAMFNLQKVLIGEAMYNTAAENMAATLARIYADHVLLYYAPPTPSKEVPSFMYTFNWAAVKGYNWQTRVFDRPLKDMEEVQVGYYADEKITGAALAFLITNVNCSQ